MPCPARILLDADDEILYCWYSNLNLTYRNILKIFKEDKAETDKYINECLDEDFLVEISNEDQMGMKRRVRLFTYADTSLAFERVDRYIRQGRWIFDDKTLNTKREKPAPVVSDIPTRGQPELKQWIQYFLLKTKKNLAMDDLRHYYPDKKQTKRRERVFMKAIQELLKDKKLEFDPIEETIRLGRGMSLKLMKTKNWSYHFVNS